MASTRGPFDGLPSASVVSVLRTLVEAGRADIGEEETANPEISVHLVAGHTFRGTPLSVSMDEVLLSIDTPASQRNPDDQELVYFSMGSIVAVTVHQPEGVRRRLTFKPLPPPPQPVGRLAVQRQLKELETELSRVAGHAIAAGAEIPEDEGQRLVVHMMIKEAAEALLQIADDAMGKESLAVINQVTFRDGDRGVTREGDAVIISASLAQAGLGRPREIRSAIEKIL